MELLVTSGVGVVAFVVLFVLRRAGQRRNPAKMTAAAFSSINIAGAFGLAWLAARMLRHDGVMPVELSITAGLLLILILITAFGMALERRGRMTAALILLGSTAGPTLAAIGFLFYLDANPIDMR